MSNYGDIAGGIKTVVEAAVTKMKVLDYPPEQVNQFPAVLVTPVSINPTVHFGGNTFEASFRLTVLVSSADVGSGWKELYDMIDPTDANSIIKALRDSPTLNGKVDTSVITEVTNIGRREWFGGGFYYGFDLTLEVAKAVA